MIDRAASWADSPTIGIVLAVLFALLVVAKNFMGTFHLETVRYFFRDKERVADADADNTLAATLLLSFCAIVVYGLFLAIVFCRCAGLPYTGARSLWLPPIMASMALLWLLAQWALLKAAGYCANKSAAMLQFIRAFFAVFIVCGLLLFPVVVGLVYAPPVLFDALMYVGFGCMAVGLILLIAKCLQLFFSGFDTVCYLFLYLCTLEILPVLLLRNVVGTLVANVLT